MKIIVLIVLLSVSSIAQLRPSSGGGGSTPGSVTKSPASVVDASLADPFTNASNALTCNNTRASAVNNLDLNPSRILAQDFGFAIPVSATLTTWSSTIEHRDVSNGEWQMFYVLDDAFGEGDNELFTFTAGATDTSISRGEDFDPSTTVAEVNDANFGVYWNYFAQDPPQTIDVDCFNLTINYTVPSSGGASTLLGFKRSGISRN